MSALFDDPIRCVTDEGKQALILGVIDDLYSDSAGGVSSTPRLLIANPRGEISVAGLGEARTLWRYGVIPTGERKGELGWYDDIPADEEASQRPNPIDAEDDDT